MLGVGVGFDTKVRFQQSIRVSSRYNLIGSEHHDQETTLMADYMRVGWTGVAAKDYH